MLTRKLFILPIILLFISCTVTKRVHRPGYHVQWHKTQRTPAPEKAAIDVQDVAQNNHSPEEKKPQIAQTVRKDSLRQQATKLQETTETLEIAPEKQKKNLDFKRIVSLPEELLIATFQKTTNDQQTVKANHKSRPIFWRMSAKNLKFLGLFFIWMGGFLLLGSVLVYAGAFSGNGTGAWANFFLDLISISNWFWLLIFLLVIILVMYLAVLFVRSVFGGPLIGLIVGLSLLIIGIFFYALGDRREIEP